MRLTTKEINTICEILVNLDQYAQVYLFGSRTDDAQKGGDIDLLVHSSTLQQNDIRRMRWQLLERLGEQKIDIVLSQQLNEPFVQMILPTAIQLKPIHN